MRIILIINNYLSLFCSILIVEYKHMLCAFLFIIHHQVKIFAIFLPDKLIK